VPALIAAGAPERLRELDWLLGRWQETARVYETPTTPAMAFTAQEHHVSEGSYVLDGHWLHFRRQTVAPGAGGIWLTWDRDEERWLMVGFEGHATAMRAYGDDDGDGGIVFEDSFRILGEPCDLRQHLRRESGDAWGFFNSERRPDGSWLPIDEHRYVRIRD
jgi:hypothetical protein